MSELNDSIRRLSRAIEEMWTGVWEGMAASLPAQELKIHRSAVMTGVTAERELEALRGTRATKQIEQIQELCQAAGFYANDPVTRVFDALFSQGNPRTAAAVREKAAELKLPFVGKKH